MVQSKLFTKLWISFSLIAVILITILFYKRTQTNQLASPKSLTQTLIKQNNNILQVSIDDLQYEIPLSEINPYYIKIQKSQNNFLQKLLHKQDIQYQLIFDITPIIKHYPIELNNPEGFNLKNKDFSKCKEKEFNLAINYSKLTRLTQDALINHHPLTIKLEDILQDPEEKNIFNICNDYQTGKEILKKNLSAFSNNSQTFDQLFEYKISNYNNFGWQIKNVELLRQLLGTYNKQVQQEPKDGSYEIINQTIYLYQPFQEGKRINVDETISNLQSDLPKHHYQFNLVYNITKPQIEKLNLPILDFTQIIGVGQTRLPLETQNHLNYAIPYAQGPLYELNHYIIQPEETFSFIKAVKRDPIYDQTAHGYPIGAGSCNSTTTLFRAALEAGLPIIERHDHGFYVQSYTWGYPHNIVDAAYNPNPAMDLKFKNDFPYPILIQFVKTKDNKFQYHTVYLRTNAKAKKRSITLTNWKIWNKKDQYHYYGSFDRIVKDENGQVILKDTFESHYIGKPVINY